MRLTEDGAGELNWIRHYDAQQITVNARALSGPCIVAPRALIAPWSAKPVAQLELHDLQPAIELGARILLLGQPLAALDVDPQLRRTLRERAIGFEAMDRGAVCRTYNVLVSEGREVAAFFW